MQIFSLHHKDFRYNHSLRTKAKNLVPISAWWLLLNVVRFHYNEHQNEARLIPDVGVYVFKRKRIKL